MNPGSKTMQRTTAEQKQQFATQINLKKLLELAEKKQLQEQMPHFNHDQYSISLNDLTVFTDFSFTDLCKLSLTQGFIAKQILEAFVTLTDQISREDIKTKTIKTFIGSNPHEALTNVTHLHFIDAILSSKEMRKYLGLPDHPNKKLDDCLLQECDFSEAIKLARHQTVSREGAYEFDANRTLYNHTDSLWWKFYLTEQQKIESLREKALEMKGYHPIPEIKPWQGQFHFMNLIHYLESKCRNHCANRSSKLIQS